MVTVIALVTRMHNVPSLTPLPHTVKVSAPLGTHLVIEGRVADEQLVGEHSDGPRVHTTTVVQLLLVLVLVGAGLEGTAKHLRGLQEREIEGLREEGNKG